MQQLVNKPKFMVLMGFLASVMGILTVNAQQLYNQGKIKPTDSELYIRKDVGTGGTINLLEGLSTSTVGISNFDGQRLDTDRNFVIDALTVNYGVAAIGASPSAVDYTTGLPAALKNSHLVIRQNNEVIVKLPISSIFDAKNTDVRYRELDGFALLKDSKTISIDLEMPAGADLAPGGGNAGFVEVALKGFETYIKA